MTREEIEEQMDELARKYIEIHDPEIPEEIYKLAR
jgi:metal-sulfur cluster biosynthetic enzyme